MFTMVANNKLIILVLLISLLPHIIFSSASAQELDTKAYVDSWCQETKYQNLCVRSLTPYVRSRTIQSPEELVLFVVKESLNLANNTKAFLLSETLRPQFNAFFSVSASLLTAIVKDLTEILSALSNGAEGDGGIKLGNNLQRWTSTVLTDAETLVSKLQGRRLSKLEATIKEKVKNVEETTSNAVAIIKHYAATRH
ncbi:unnamed protein product [Eruca vesicaria subsp. sativa]|uniref:Pectinesterase inhibitor domain-containing protein n=1 Tax=Eruca vesicaria subsp. sativa TaxID=29727 RepID=A0ABC8JQG4_ERUVS|nr:unnamed protein product [Eruca vesicaria subsp. sativa]